MVMTDPVSQDPDELRRLSGTTACRSWRSTPRAYWSPNACGYRPVAQAGAGEGSGRHARRGHRGGASTVSLAAGLRPDFVRGLARMGDVTDVRFAVENMYPWRARSRELAAYSPGWDVRDEDYLHTTLDLSHTAVSGSDALRMADDLGIRWCTSTWPMVRAAPVMNT